MTLAEEFARRDAGKPKPKWVYGDRVFATWNKIPVIGMVIREDYNDPKQVLIHLDLAIKDEQGDLRWVLLVPAKGMKKLVVFNE